MKNVNYVVCAVTGAMLMVAGISSAQAQQWPTNAEDYQQMKAAGTLPDRPVLSDREVTPIQPVIHAAGTPKGGGNLCNCWVEPDSSYTTVDNSSQWDASGFHNPDDGNTNKS